MPHKGDKLVWEVCLIVAGFILGMLVFEPSEAPATTATMQVK